MQFEQPILIAGSVQNYAWGKPASSSLVAKLAGALEGISHSPQQHFAELWFGTHPSAPSPVLAAEYLVRSDERRVGRDVAIPVTLKELIHDYPDEMLGCDGLAFARELPFLVKILSIQKALSIQVHPHRKMAEQLHHDFPTIFRDPFPKPEIAIALTPVQLLWGVRPEAEVRKFVRTRPWLEPLFAPPGLPNGDRFIEHAFRQLMHASVLEITELVTVHLAHLGKGIQPLAAEDTLSISLAAEFGSSDPGVLTPYLMNLLSLKPSEAIFTPPGVIHAYLSGDLIECMAPSDNVIRAALTTKPRDIVQLLKTVNFSAISPVRYGVSTGGQKYEPPVEEFAVETLFGSIDAHSNRAHSAELFVVLAGTLTITGHFKAVAVTIGHAAFIPAGLGYTTQLTDDCHAVRVWVPEA